MLPYALIDLHCDTLTALRPEDAPLLDAFRDPARRGEAAASPVTGSPLSGGSAWFWQPSGTSGFWWSSSTPASCWRT